MNSVTKKNTIYILASVLIFFLAWYDTFNNHIFTDSFNNWALQILYVSSSATGKWQPIYYDALNDITALGGESLFHLALIFLFLYLVVERQTEAVIYCFFAGIIIVAITVMFKFLFISPRPMVPEVTSSFPSGHVVRTCIWCGIILFLNHIKVFHLSRYWCGVFITIPLLVGFSRLGLGFHWISDVIASYALSIAVFFSVLMVRNKIKAQELSSL